MNAQLQRVIMNLKLRALFLLLVLVGGTSALAGTVYFGAPPTPNDMAPVPAGGGLAMASGGNVDTIQLAPAAGGGNIRLVQSVVGFVCATPIGVPNNDLNTVSAAKSALTLATRYRYKVDAFGSLIMPPTERADGMFTIVATGATGRNYFEADIPAIADTYRVVIRMNALSPIPYVGLLQTYEERIVASVTLANEDYVDSVRERLLPIAGDTNPGDPSSPLGRQRAKLLSARQRLDDALMLFAQLARDPVEGYYLQPEAPLGVWTSGDNLPVEASRLFDSYVRALALAIEIEEQVQRLDYFLAYGNPLEGSGPPLSGPGSAAAVAVRAGFYEDYSVLAGAYTHLESFAYAPVSRVKSELDVLRSLEQDIRLSRVTFQPGSQQPKGSGGSDFVQTSFGPHFVPFLNAQIPGATANRTFDNMVALTFGSGTFAGALKDALDAETDAQNASEQVINNVQMLKERTALTLVQYNGQLIDLCGSVPSPNDGTPMPDLYGYMFPPDLRRSITGRDGSGAMLVQYARIESVHTKYDLAVQDFTDLYREIDITEQAAAEKAGIVRTNGQAIAHIFTANGEQFALLDQAAADVQAATTRAVALRQAQDYKKGFLSKLGKLVSIAAVSVAGAFATVATAGVAAPAAAAATISASTWVGVSAGAGAAAATLGEIEAWNDLNKQGQTIAAVGDLQAASITSIAEITKAQTRLRAAESANVALINAEGQALLIEATAREEIQKLYVRMERLKLNILLAEQDITIAELELVNLFDKVGYLLQEYQEAVRQLADLPLNRPDFRYIRDYRIAVAEDAFRRAQMWVYLTAKSAQYRFMTTGSYEQSSDLVWKTLRCRNATELNHKVATTLKDLGPLFYLNNGFAAEGQTKNVILSLRDQVFQNNYLSRGADGVLNTNTPSFFLPVAGAGTNGLPPERASDAQWLGILNANLTGAAEGQPVLRVTFSTSFDPRGNNPMYTELADQFGHVILSTPSGGLNRKGVIINIKGRSIPLRSYQTKLEQLGTTYLTYKERNNESAWLGTKFPVRTWGLPSRGASITAVLNKDSFTAFTDANIPAASGFDERSPYCDQWQLTIDGSSVGSPNWRLLTFDLGSITDIEVGMTIAGFDPQKL
jgi:hypothetical protein